jgi:hypothetical protein
MIAMNRHALCIVVVILVAGCRHVENTPVRVVNLIRELDRAELRPANGFEIATRDVGGTSYPSIVVPVPSRLTVPLPLPRRGVLRAFASLEPPAPGVPPVPVRLRVGVSDNRIYERLTDVVLSPGDRGWVGVQTDLSAYAGWKWSLFYHPDRIMWHVVLAADAIAGVPARAVWGSPEIVTDNESAKEYSARRQRLR